MVLYVGALVHPIATSLCVRTVDYQLVKHGDDYFGHGMSVCVLASTGGTSLFTIFSLLLLLLSRLLSFPRV
jgi:hypothetical protein